jgi:hypothetical protein
VCRYGHQLPDLLLKLSVAGTYAVEIPAPFLILLPFRPARLAAAALQAFLQVCVGGCRAACGAAALAPVLAPVHWLH